jgi:thioester reductase-like protein
LVAETKCKALLHSTNIDAYVHNVEAGVPGIPKYQVPSFDQLRHQGCQGGLYIGQYDDSETALAIILHTSGSTGIPKPIYVTHGALATTAYMRDKPTHEGRLTAPGFMLESQAPILVTSPFFHAMGVLMITRSIFCLGPLVLLPPQRPPNAQLVLDVLELTRPWSAFFPPSLLEELSTTSRGIDAMAKLTYIIFGGAPLASAVGEKLSQYTTVVSFMGSTEGWAIPTFFPVNRNDFNCHEWTPDSGIKMDPQGDGLYEMVITRAGQPEIQAAFFNFPEIDEWRTKDLFEKHPVAPNLWTYKCRKDDVIVLNNGEKVNPVTFEKTMESEPLVKAALVTGATHFQTALLIEPNWDLLDIGEDTAGLIDRLWPIIERANADCPTHARVWRSRVAIASKGRPFIRAPKGSVLRRATTQNYQPVIDALYLNQDSTEHVELLKFPEDIQGVRRQLRQAMKRTGMGLPNNASGDADIFSFGVDSLQVLALSSLLSHSFSRSKTDAISTRVIYSHPTIDSLAAYLLAGGDDHNADATNSTGREEAMAAMVERYTRDLPTSSVLEPAVTPDRHTVILTGSTGSLGNYVLQELISSPVVARVFCFNRSAAAATRQRHSFVSRGHEANFAKVNFLHTDLGQDRFGLSEEVYTSLLDSVDIFIHNAWPVNFNQDLESYETVHVAGVRRCVDFSRACQHRAKIVFMSSVAGIGNWLAKNPINKEVPEKMLYDHSLPLPQGYGESKHVAELILDAAATRSGIPVTIVRAGQLAGPSDGRSEWNRKEWLPSLVMTSMAMGLLPDRLGNQNAVDWVPMNLAARIVWEIATAKRSQGDGSADVAHLVNPRMSSWSSLVPAVQKALGGAEKVKIVSFAEWVEKLTGLPRTEKDIKNKPAIKLIDFFQNLVVEGGVPRLATVRTAKMSRTLKETRAVDEKMMQIWIAAWSKAIYHPD